MWNPVEIAVKVLNFYHEKLPNAGTLVYTIAYIIYDWLGVILYSYCIWESQCHAWVGLITTHRQSNIYALAL